MEYQNPDIEQIQEIFRKYNTIAVVGLSREEDRPSNRVASYLKKVGYKIIPVNPGQKEILGEKCFASLSEIPEKVEIVDIFRRPEQVLPIVEEAIKIGAKVVWMQDGVINDQAAQKAQEAGLVVVMDRCMYRDHSTLMR
jgi:predicted CoA-binding protein